MLMGTLILFNKKEASEFEMRKLKKYPELTKENIFDGSFGKEFEDALTDRVPEKGRKTESIFHFQGSRKNL